MKNFAGCDDGLPDGRLSLENTNQLPDAEAWLLEVLSVERKKGNKVQTSARGAAGTVENGGPRLLSYPTEGKGESARACALESNSQQIPTEARSLATSASGPSTPGPVLVETWDGLQAVQFNYVDVEKAKQTLLLSLSPHPSPPSYVPACRGNLPGAMPLQGAMVSSSDDNNDQLQNAFMMEERDFPDLARGFSVLSGAERRGVLSRLVELSQEILVGDHFDSSPMQVDTVMLAVHLFGIYIGVTNAVSLDALPQGEVELLPGVCLLAAFKFDEDVCNVLPKLVKVLASDEESWEHVKKNAASLEWKMLRQTDFRLTTPTAATFLHLFLERAVSEGALAQQDTLIIGAKATEITWGWVGDGFGVDYTPSELAVTALYFAALHEHGVATALKIAAVAGVPLDCPRFLRLCLREKPSSRRTTDSAGAGMYGGADGESSHKESVGGEGEVGSILAGESDTDGVTPLPSANVREKREAFFHEGQDMISRPQAGHDKKVTPSRDASMRKPLRDLGNKMQVLIAPANDRKEIRAPARTTGHGGQAVASYSASWGNRADVRAAPPPTTELRSPAMGLERAHSPLGDDCYPTELVTLHTAVEESINNTLVDVAACPTPPATAALLCGVHGGPDICDFDWGRSTGRQSPMSVLRCINGARGEAGFDGVFSQPKRRVDDDVGVGESRSGEPTGRPLAEIDMQWQDQSRITLSRRKGEAETTTWQDVDVVSAVDSSGVDLSLAEAREKLRVSIPPSISSTRVASEARLPPVDDPRDDQQGHHGKFGCGGRRSCERGGVDGRTNGRQFAIQSSSPSRRLLAPADVWSDDEEDWLKMTTRDLQAAGEVLRRVEHELAAQRKQGQLSWTRGGLLVPRDSCGGGVSRRER